jgi:hypothetical protein
MHIFINIGQAQMGGPKGGPKQIWGAKAPPGPLGAATACGWNPCCHDQGVIGVCIYAYHVTNQH